MKLKDEIIITLGAVFMTILTFTIIVVLTYLFSILIDIILMFGR